MSDKVFLDTNILIYLFDSDSIKKGIVKNLLKQRPIISIQVINELSNVLIKKFKFEESDIKEILKKILENSHFFQIDQYIVFKALDIKKRYKFSYYDSLIVSSAISSQCQILYSEDMQHGQQIENLMIINPLQGINNA